MVGLGLFTAASLSAGLATSAGFLVAMRALQGVGAAVVLPAALSIVTNIFSEGADRNKALGAWGAIGGAAATVGLITGGLVTRYVGRQYIFFLNVPIGAAPLLLARRLVPESRMVGVRRRFDPLGAVSVTGGLLALVYAISNAPQVGWSSARTVGLLAASAVLLIAFLLVESRVEAPLLPLRIFRLRTVAPANAVGLLLGGSFFGFIFVGTLYMQQVLGYSALQTGAAWLTTSLTSVALVGLSQKLVTRISPGPVMAAGMALIGVGILWATQVPVQGHFWASLAGPFCVVGAGGAFSFVPISIGGLTGVTEREAGLASGLLYTSQQLGVAIGVAVASTVAVTHAKTLLAGSVATSAALTAGFQWAFWVCAATALLAPLTAAVLLCSRRPNEIDRGVPALEIGGAN